LFFQLQCQRQSWMAWHSNSVQVQMLK
jgi:hypothetical protein